MKPRPIRMPDSLWDDLADEADDRGLSTAEYVRNLLRNRNRIQADTQPDTQADTDTGQLRERVQALERAVYDDGGSAPAQHPDTQPDTQDGGASAPDSLDRWLAKDGPKTEHGRRGVRRCVEELVKHGPLTSQKLTDMLQEEIGDEYGGRKSMWESVKRWLIDAPGIQQTENYQEWAFSRPGGEL